ncbi:peptidylprolyl isomerase [Tropicimonas sp. TH_r6]|uniref:peptidylprolyl isomerase n=1 Tax=Tropicimonas sp. TH_r6 TaxID=3082085 RepID=UPI0029536FFF|nr:peptidylprolyl isomerase [Tropicimonas sp. TH_r6]MDV7142905.1 peptidylprolyl isomerase [Tropicimonas sp. TH_r6]
MSRDRWIAGGIFAAGVSLVLGYAAVELGAVSPAMAAEDGPGPNLVLEIAGEANGTVVIDLLPDVAAKHSDRLVSLAEGGEYDEVVFHRVIDGFMAQTGDVQFGKAGGDTRQAGTGGSSQPDLPAEFSDVSFDRGVVGMARSQNPNSANSQFFIMFAPAPHLNGQYTVVGRVIDGMDVVDSIKKGSSAANGAVKNPDRIVKVTVER